METKIFSTDGLSWLSYNRIVSLARLIGQQCLQRESRNGGVAADIEPSTPVECRDRSTELGSVIRVRCGWLRDCISIEEFSGRERPLLRHTIEISPSFILLPIFLFFYFLN